MKEPNFAPTWGQRFEEWLPKSFGDRLHLGVQTAHIQGEGSVFVRKAYVVVMWETELHIWKLLTLPIPGTRAYLELLDIEELTGVIDEEWDLDGED